MAPCTPEQATAGATPVTTPLKIGTLLPETGSLAFLGPPEIAGTEYAASEVNANEKDTKDHPFGVDTLPPVRLTAPAGQPPDPEFDRTPYDAIGESDRMTLKFRKPE